MKSKSHLGKQLITILDSPWTVYFKTDKQYKRDCPKGSRAVCMMLGKYKTIHFNCEATHPGDGVVIHELVHAYSHELMGHDINLTPDQREEFFCTLFETRGPALLKLSRPISKKLAKYSRSIKKPVQEEEDE
jgi:hypothetical protein